MFKKNKFHVSSSVQKIVVLTFLLSLSVAAFCTYFFNHTNLPYADSISRLDIARKIVDNLNPGLAQLGSVWLPLPQLLMLPFIWNNYMWHSGLAGTLMSSISFIVGGYFLYKSAYVISRSFVASFFTLCVYALNINMFYLQTTAMSEGIFVCLLTIVTYHFLKWVNTNQRRYLIFAGIAVSGITLIRYEGLALLLSSIGFVALYTIVKERSYKKLESNLIAYCCVAGLGFLLWTLYLTAIFGDPFFWLRYYGAAQVVTSDNATDAVASYSQAKPFLAAAWQYFSSVTWMAGIIPVALSLLGFLIGAIVSIWKKSWNIVVLLLPLSIFFLMVLTLQRNTPIVQPNLSIVNILSNQTSMQTGFNIRYGLMLLPWVALLSVYVFNLRKPFYLPALFFFAVFLIQPYDHFKQNFSPIFEIPRHVYAKPDQDMVTWLQKNYDGGYIMMSASGFEDQMFMLGFPYRTYIHEGAGKYWTEALDRPARYASWIVIDFNRSSDTLAKEFLHKQYWSWDYNLVWQDPKSSVKIYKIKTHPDLAIPDR